MEMMTLLGMLTLLTSIAVFTVTVVGDCDILTLLYSKLGKRPEAEFSGKVVWVTGASSGIGEAIAKELATAGARLVLSARRKKELERVKRECLENSLLNDEDVLVLPLDVTNLHAHRPSLARVLSYFGKLDLLVSNAGQSQLGEFTDIDISVHRHIFELNVVSVVNMNQIVVKYFLKIGEGHVAVVSSTSGRVSAPFSSAYSASKHAINDLLLPRSIKILSLTSLERFSSPHDVGRKMRSFVTGFYCKSALRILDTKISNYCVYGGLLP